MAFQVSPGVNISEIDLTTVVPAVATSVGAFAGVFSWGPAEERTLVSSENTLVSTFGKPTVNNFETFYTAANFLAYGNALYVVRAINTAARNAQAIHTGTEAATIQIKNLADYQDGITASTNAVYYARYAGELGNSLKISVCDSATAYSTAIDLSIATGDSITYSTGYDTSTVFATTKSTSKTTATTTSLNTLTTFNTVFDTTGAGTTATETASDGTVVFTLVPNSNTANVVVTSSDGLNAAKAIVQDIIDSLVVGDYLQVSNNAGFASQKMKIAPAGLPATPSSNATAAYATITFTSKYTGSANVTATGADANTSLTRYWEFHDVVDKAPGQSTFVATYGNTAAQDELHVVVVDEDGLFTGVKNQVLEVFEGVSRATDAKADNGQTLYYKTVIENDSQYIYWAKDRPLANSNTAALVASSTQVAPMTKSFVAGVNTSAEDSVTVGVLASAYDLFKDPDVVDVSLVMAGRANTDVANYVIDNIATTRKDCVAFVSPTRSTSADSIVTFRNTLSSTSYAVIDSGYKYQYDRYNDVYRYIPLNGDIAGLCARTDSTNDPWYSPAGFSRGQIKNVVKLNFNPNQAERDVLYKNGVNPVVTFPGQGTILFGDKTMLTKPSAFDRINVRRLFIVLEKAISTAAKFALFEFNDEFTRAQFRNLVEPYLREVQGRRGITDYRVICDTTNNTGDVIDRGEFVGDIYIKPARSINYIQLNFVAVRSGVDFNEIVKGV
jgi:phage tail sheath protein FI